MKNNDYIFALGAMLVLAGAILQISGNWIAPYVVGVGGLVIFVFRLVFTPKNENFRIKRLMKMQLVSSVFLLVSAYLMYTNNPRNAWALTLFLAAFLDIFIIWRMPKEEK